MQDKKPGILVINGCLPPPYGGIARYLSRMLPLLVEDGYRVWAAMPRGYSSHSYAGFRAGGIEIVMPPKNNRQALPSLALRYAPMLWERCVRHRLPWQEALLALNEWLPELDALLARSHNEIDIVHVYDAPWHQGWIGRMLAAKYGKRLVLTTYGEVVPHADPLQLVDDLSYRYQRLSAEIVAAANAIGSMTAYCASKLAFLGVKPQHVLSQHHVVGMSEFQSHPALPALETKYPQLQGRRLILYAGQLLARKGPQLLVQAAPALLARYPDCLFAFVGPDLGMLSELQTLSGTLGLSDHCLFTGAVSDEELRQFYQRAQLFVFTTVSPIECLGLTFVQAMVAHCPVVAADISGVPEVIRDGENGLLFAPGNRQQLQEQLLRVLDDPSLSARLAEQGYQDVTTTYSEQSALCQLERLYAEALACP